MLVTIKCKLTIHCINRKYGTITPYLVEVTGATGHDLLDLRINAVLNPVFCAEPICGAEVLFLLLLVPHK